MSPRGSGPWLAGRWAGLYTRGLPDDIRARRRAEIASDLWEHGRDSVAAGSGRLRHDADVIQRVLAGAAADLSWRRAVARSAASTRVGGSTMRERMRAKADHALGVLVPIGIVPVVAILPVLGSPSAAALLWLLLAVTLGAALVAGLVIRDRHPGLSTALLVLGSAAPSVAFFWLPPVYLVTAVIGGTALVAIPSRGTTAPLLP